MLAQVTKKRPRAKLKGFPVRLERTRWRMLLASMLYQERIEPMNDEQAQTHAELFDWISEKIGTNFQGVKTLRVRSTQVGAMKDALRFAAKLWKNLKGDYTSWRRFEENLEALEDVHIVDMLGDAGR